MFPPKEIAQNIVLGSSRVRRFAATRHNTGLLSRQDHAERTLSRFAEHLPSGIDGLDILELGPGQGLGLVRAASQRGARCAAFDVASYLDAAALTGVDVDYRVDPDGRLPWPAESFDVVWSYSVLEHVRAPDSLLRQTADVLRPGGHHLAWIDLENHLGGRGDPRRMYEFLRYPEWLWNAMTSNRSSYVNRLRVSEWRAGLERAGFSIRHEEDYPAACGLPALRDVDYLSHLSDADLLTKQVLIVAQKDSTNATDPG